MAKWSLARGSGSWLAATGAGVIVLMGLALWSRDTVVGGIAILALLVFAFLINFFRDPERPIAPGVASPADGVVQFVEALPDGSSRVAIFMNPLDVHVNRAPLDGRVVAVEHKPGGFVPAFKKESERNERVEWVFETEHGRLKLVQIAGTVARRIVPYLAAGAVVKKGDRIGMIRLGSRVDVTLPANLEATVKAGERVWAGATTLAISRKGSA
jgi:phosphatidylserine decarboxylase